jgi:hypothetical protein
MVIWYSPAVPVVRTELMTRTGMPPTVTVGALAVAGAPLTSTPAGAAGMVGPNPVAHSTSIVAGNRGRGKRSHQRVIGQAGGDDVTRSRIHEESRRVALQGDSRGRAESAIVIDHHLYAGQCAIRRNLHINLRGADVVDEGGLAVDGDAHAAERSGQIVAGEIGAVQVRVVLARLTPLIIAQEPARCPVGSSRR